ncbi:MAG TPA: C25 family cysteine peptidase [Solirubrobacteraceae bacterium]|nr:C25 family cysteine peptidase [Solirubrobacteraceae bacterium]
MPNAVRRATAVIVGASLLLPSALGAPALAAKATKTVNATATLSSLVKQTRSLPKAAASKRAKANLLRSATRARSVARRNPCSALSRLSAFRKTLRATKIRPGSRLSKTAQARLRSRLAALGPASLRSSRKLLADKRAKRCGGGVVPSTLSSVKSTVLSSDVNGMTVRVSMPQLQFAPQTGGGRNWTQLVLPSSASPSGDGKPDIPVVSQLVGVPDGAKLSVVAGSTESYEIEGVDVYPAQPEALDDNPIPGPPGGDPNNPPRPDFDKGQFAPPPFTIDNAAYKTDALVPAAPASGQILGEARDVVVGNLQVPAAQYDAADRSLKVLNTVDVRATFDGGAKTFTPELNSPWERAQRTLVSSLLNRNAILSKLEFVLRRCGEEMLVITNPATQAAADQFAVGKRAQGWRTNVFQVGAGAAQIGTTPAQIQAFIRSRLTALLCIHPSYVTIMGDDDLVPTFTDGPSGIPSDLKYALKTDADELPDLAIGRIIGNDQAHVATAVTKILAYETTAPNGNGMLNKALIAAQFQDDDNDGQENRTFITMAETVRDGLVARGVAVDRVYGEHPGNNPQRFQDGSALPASLLKANGFGWNGTGAQVSAGWNAGRFMVVHRDHGWSDGWGTPGYGTADVQALTNANRLPVVLSINCSSGAYDYDETSFAGEALVTANGGAVGVFGDTRDSPSTANTQMSLGFVDALLPSVLPSEGPATKQRTGDALNHGKMRLNGIAPLPNGTTRSEFYLWHYYGDPSMQMWGGGNAPIVFDPALVKATYKPGPISIPDPPPFEVAVNLGQVLGNLAGQPISLLQNGQVIGKAFLDGDGTATIPASFGDGSVEPGELEVAFEGDGAQPFKVPVEGVPAPPPPPPPPPPPTKADLVVTALAQNSITVKNQAATAAPAFVTTITALPTTQLPAQVLSFGPLAAGASASAEWGCLTNSPYTATADARNAVDESDETNNTLTQAFPNCG